MRTAESVRPMTVGQFKDMVAMATHAVPTTMSFEDAEQAINRKPDLQAEVELVFRQIEKEATRRRMLIQQWRRFYKSPANEGPTEWCRFPDKVPPGFGQTVIVNQENWFTQYMIKQLAPVKVKMTTWMHRHEVRSSWRPADPAGWYAFNIQDTWDWRHVEFPPASGTLDGCQPMTLNERLAIELYYGSGTARVLPLTVCHGSTFGGEATPVVAYIDKTLWIDGVPRGEEFEGHDGLVAVDSDEED